MRTHPIGVIGVGLSEKDALELSISVGWTTHVDPRCTVSCCIEVALIRGLLRCEIIDEEDVNACIERCYKWVKESLNSRTRADERCSACGKEGEDTDGDQAKEEQGEREPAKSLVNL
jgi:hypothetical protein